MEIQLSHGTQEHRKGTHYPPTALCRCGHLNAFHSAKYGCDVCFKLASHGQMPAGRQCSGFRPTVIGRHRGR